MVFFRRHVSGDRSKSRTDVVFLVCFFPRVVTSAGMRFILLSSCGPEGGSGLLGMAWS